MEVLYSNWKIKINNEKSSHTVCSILKVIGNISIV